MSHRPTGEHTRVPGPFPAGRRCEHEARGVRCSTVLNSYHEGCYCHAHEDLHQDEPGELRLDPRFLPNEAVAQLVRL